MLAIAKRMREVIVLFGYKINCKYLMCAYIYIFSCPSSGEEKNEKKKKYHVRPLSDTYIPELQQYISHG